MPRLLDLKDPFKTSAGFKDDNVIAGYNPERIPVVNTNDNTETIITGFNKKLKLRCVPSNTLNCGIKR